MSDLNDIQKSVSERIDSMRNKADTQVGMEDVLIQGKTYSSSDAEKEATESPRRRHRNIENTDNSKDKNPMMMKAIVFGIAALVGVIVIVGMSMYLTQRKEKVQNDWVDSIGGVDSEFTYSDSEVELLRLNGYTGYEIEEYAALGYPADSLVEEAEAERESLLAEEYADLLDSASPEYQELRNKTWLGQKEFPIDEGTEPLTKYTQNMNLDYEKVTASGYQLWLKLYVKEDLAVFMTVSPDRWNSLSDSGNIVVQLEYVKMENGYIVITNITEIPT